MKDKILKLWAEGNTYDAIKRILKCSKGTISYHCGEGQKRKSNLRNQRNRINKKGINEICEYGCKTMAVYLLKNGKWCCNKNHNHCQGTRNKHAKRASKYFSIESEIIETCKNSKSLLEASRRLKIPYNSLSRHAKRLGIEKIIYNLTVLTEKQKKRFIKICLSSLSMAKASKKLGLYFGKFRKIAKELNVYRPNPNAKGVRKGGIKRKFTLQDILEGKYPKCSRAVLKRLLIISGLKKHKCEICNRTKWMGKIIPIELDHKDGDNTNHRGGNIRLICPNCHAQTPNYRGKNIKKHKMRILNQQQQV